MRYFYDTEFIEDGNTITLVSIGVVAEDGREYYAVSTEFDPAQANSWVRQHVLDKLPSPSSPVWKSEQEIKAELLEFFGGAHVAPQDVELWAWVGCYDHVVLAQLWGDMQQLPRQIPRFTRELKQLWEMAGKPALPPSPPGNHDALVDARHNLEKFKVCHRHLPIDSHNRISSAN